ncbi:MAG: S41 family peptidase [Bacteroidales bacterium]|nr:S41 family peptidase [Bacteroidales bacterium]
MAKGKISSVWVALLGVVIGVLVTLTVTEIRDRNAQLKSKYQSWGKLNLVLRTIEENYVDSVDFEKASDAAAEAALRALDPHSVYMPPVELETSTEDLSGNFDGIGIQFNVPNDTAIVLEVIPGGPSEKIGLMQGDRILKVDSTDIAGVSFPQDSIVRRIKGPAGSKVLITVKRGNETIPFEITRGKIPNRSLAAGFMVNDTTAYVKVSRFTATTASEFLQSSIDLVQRGMKRMIVDLRDNSGGYMEPALNMSNMFLSKGDTIVYLMGRNIQKEVYKANGDGHLQDVALTVIIDDGTASASEIFSGAVQDNGRGVLVGRRSFGKGLVQQPFNFTDGSGIRLTIARYYTPSGRCIQKPYTEDYDYETYKRYNTGEMVCADSMKLAEGGIIPDVFVPLDTTRVTPFYISCNRKSTTVRFASAFFDSHREELASIDDYDALLKYLDGASLDRAFLSFALKEDALSPAAGEWDKCKSYMMAQVRALVGRYSKLGDNAFYHLYLAIDEVYAAALTAQ